MSIYDDSLEIHKKLKGKITTSLRATPMDKKDLSLFYSPGVAAVSEYVAQHPEQMRDYTWTNNLVAVISDGSAVLGLGDIGPEGAMPVMEGKAMLFKALADVDAVPIILDVHTVEEIVSTVKAIAKSFGGINLEDIAAPKCFEIEDRLRVELDIPVMHDDQHGTAIVVLAGLINSLKLRGNADISSLRVVIVGAGAAGTAVGKLLALYGFKDIAMVDSKGIVGPKRTNLNDEKIKLLGLNNLGRDGDLADAVNGADIFIGVSKPGLLTAEMVATMAPKPVVFAMANPEPEILPDVAKAAGVFIIATGRSDYPNQVNNSLAFPGIFRGALDNGVKKITDDHKIAAAKALANLVKNPTVDQIVPDPFDPEVVKAVAAVIV